MTSDLRTTTLEVQHPNADEAFVTGDFNRWSVPGVRMQQARPGVWNAEVPAPWARSRMACAVLVRGRVMAIVPVSRDAVSPEEVPASQPVSAGLRGRMK